MLPRWREAVPKNMRLAFKTEFSSARIPPAQSGRNNGAVLLEVVLALALFVTAATIITSGLNASLAGVERLRSNIHAANLAVSVLSELQLGLKTPANNGPQPFEPPFADWTWEVITIPEATSEQASPFKKLEVVVRRQDPPIAHRIFHLVALEDANQGDAGQFSRGVAP
jgi:hypothetical protein